MTVMHFPSAQCSLRGRHVKVCRHGECVWLIVRSVRPDGNMVAVVDNVPLMWPQSRGEPVEIRPDEVVRTI